MVICNCLNNRISIFFKIMQFQCKIIKNYNFNFFVLTYLRFIVMLQDSLSLPAFLQDSSYNSLMAQDTAVVSELQFIVAVLCCLEPFRAATFCTFLMKPQQHVTL